MSYVTWITHLHHIHKFIIFNFQTKQWIVVKMIMFIPSFKIGGYGGGGDIQRSSSIIWFLSEENWATYTSASTTLKYLNIRITIVIYIGNTVIIKFNIPFRMGFFKFLSNSFLRILWERNREWQSSIHIKNQSFIKMLNNQKHMVILFIH